jgi:uncharacterized protein (DUF58 family)
MPEVVSQTNPIPLLDPKVLAKISNMPLLARTVVEGTLMGLHKSPTKGSSIEFAEHKPYTQGDEIRHIDWKVYGKSERYYVKQFEEETNLRSWLVVDGSGSMGYSGGDRVTKIDYARMVAASLSYLLLGQSDAVGLSVTSDAARGEAAMLPARAHSAHLHVVCEALAKITPRGDHAVTPALDKIAEVVHRRSMVIVLSDLLEDPAVIGAALRRLQGRRQDVVVFHVLDPDEIDFPFRDPIRFVDMEQPREVDADPRMIRQAYRAAFAEHLEALTRECRVAGIDYHRLTTETPLDTALIRFLGWREKIAGGRV